ncbi:unnamed protein product [Cochlearia groenlandica]
MAQFYDEIEPFCRWRRTEEVDILELHLPPGLKKDHLKIQINNNGILTITGECPVLDQTKSTKFSKETKVSKNCKRNDIRAKFSKGVLCVTMPKKISASKEGTKEARDSKANNEDDISNVAKCANGIHIMVGSFRQRILKKTIVEGVAAMVVAAAAVVGVVKAYQYVMASPV